MSFRIKLRILSLLSYHLKGTDSMFFLITSISLRDLMVYIWILLLCCYQCYPLHLLQLYIQKYPHDIFFMLIFTVFCVVPGFAFKTVTFFLTFLIVTVAFIVSIESKPIFLNFRITEVAVASKFPISRFGSKFVLVFGTSLTS